MIGCVLQILWFLVPHRQFALCELTTTRLEQQRALRDDDWRLSLQRIEATVHCFEHHKSLGNRACSEA
ncbi:hypothetical protein PC129_g11749 [Phytophthora cactorum]|uniref:Secreted protein n=1 Tax=Phytophthora cactorum TaxID=29920 RepID=A0A8T1BWW8_9STRA|nr:hypothetical protein PC112_g13622 [Phytophthora cactorum]KAG2826227.1 hypothetical protein PC111_g9046 [Phytophthora cactorum]KAG2853749.1 hypothetical protein PC113_g13921 [Phytophthora cactorum]KAG2897487.1 hypothetical protein PC114_g14667 [Phytophthora cactorum]KAG2910600.1 hypothetical protein PC115_g12854 [Phytophthora cactorum]